MKSILTRLFGEYKVYLIAVVKSFVRTFITIFIVGVGGVITAAQTGNWSVAKSLLLALLASAVGAAVRAAEQTLRNVIGTSGSKLLAPLKKFGITPPVVEPITPVVTPEQTK